MVSRGTKQPSRNQERLIKIINLALAGAPFDQIKELIGGPDADYFRQCAVCKTIYFAGKLTYKGKVLDPACSLKCNRIVRARRAKHKTESQTPSPQPQLSELIISLD